MTPESRVRYPGKFLALTGQLWGDSGHQVFAVIPCTCSLCAMGDHLALEDRHVHRANVYEVGIAFCGGNVAATWAHGKAKPSKTDRE